MVGVDWLFGEVITEKRLKLLTLGCLLFLQSCTYPEPHLEQVFSTKVSNMVAPHGLAGINSNTELKYHYLELHVFDHGWPEPYELASHKPLLYTTDPYLIKEATKSLSSYAKTSLLEVPNLDDYAGNPAGWVYVLIFRTNQGLGYVMVEPFEDLDLVYPLSEYLSLFNILQLDEYYALNTFKIFLKEQLPHEYERLEIATSRRRSCQI